MIKINKDFEGDVWVFSDPHYNHKNICRGVTSWRLPDGTVPLSQTRDFETINEMNDMIVNNINKNVMQDDILICLGDWSFGGFESIKEFLDRIDCKNIHLILGNHDHHIENNRDGCHGYFKSVSNYNTLKIDKHTFRLMHYPISSWDGLKNGVMHLHGHCHLPTSLRLGKGQRLDVGMDGHPEFRPYNIRHEVVPMLQHRDKVSEMDNDHHTDEIIT